MTPAKLIVINKRLAIEVPVLNSKKLLRVEHYLLGAASPERPQPRGAVTRTLLLEKLSGALSTLRVWALNQDAAGLARPKRRCMSACEIMNSDFPH